MRFRNYAGIGGRKGENVHRWFDGKQRQQSSYAKSTLIYIGDVRILAPNAPMPQYNKMKQNILRTGSGITTSINQLRPKKMLPAPGLLTPSQKVTYVIISRTWWRKVRKIKFGLFWDKRDVPLSPPEICSGAPTPSEDGVTPFVENFFWEFPGEFTEIVFTPDGHLSVILSFIYEGAHLGQECVRCLKASFDQFITERRRRN